MFNEDIKKQAREIMLNADKATVVFDPSETIETKDWQYLLENSTTRQLELIDKYIENGKKYEGIEFITHIDANGEVKEEPLTGYAYIDEQDRYVGTLNEYGYDRLPEDVQQAFGTKEEVVNQWMIWTPEQEELYNTYANYYNDDSHGFDTWEEYRDAKLGKQEAITIENAQNVEEVSTPKETPAVERDETPKLLK